MLLPLAGAALPGKEAMRSLMLHQWLLWGMMGDRRRVGEVNWNGCRACGGEKSLCGLAGANTACCMCVCFLKSKGLWTFDATLWPN